MNDREQWIFKTIIKLRERYIGGQAIVGELWQYDAEELAAQEDDAVQFLSTAGVLSSSVTEFSPEGTMYESDTYRSEHLKADSWVRLITKFDVEKFAAICRQFGINPYQLIYNAELTLMGEVTPVVNIGSMRYELPTMHAGKSTDIIRYCYRNANNSVSKKALQQAGINQLSNIRNALRTGYFAHGTGVLSPFINATPEACTLVLHVELTKEQLEKIRLAALN